MRENFKQFLKKNKLNGTNMNTTRLFLFIDTYGMLVGMNMENAFNMTMQVEFLLDNALKDIQQHKEDLDTKWDKIHRSYLPIIWGVLVGLILMRAVAVLTLGWSPRKVYRQLPAAIPKQHREQVQVPKAVPLMLMPTTHNATRQPATAEFQTADFNSLIVANPRMLRSLEANMNF